MSSSGSRRHYTDEFKADAVSLVTEHGYSSAEAARRLGINPNNVNRWVREHRDQQASAARGEASPKELQAEIQRLRKENKRLQMEREILKKAAAFVVNKAVAKPICRKGHGRVARPGSLGHGKGTGWTLQEPGRPSLFHRTDPA